MESSGGNPIAAVNGFNAIEVTYNCGGWCFIDFLLSVINCAWTACGSPNAIKPQDPIRCRSCGGRILYKVRTKSCKYDNYNIRISHILS